MTASAPSIDELKALLVDRLEELAGRLLGAPNKATLRRSEWRWGAKGSAALVMANRRGKFRGAFFNHETGQGGGPLDLIMYANACQVAEAIGWAKEWLGIADDDDRYQPSPASEEALRARQAQRDARTAEAAEGEAERIAYAKRLWAESRPVTGTAAATYLQETRHIPEPVGGWPDVVRFHPRSCALILLATSTAGDTRGVQRVYLTRAGAKVGPEEIEQRRLPAVKQSSGVFEGAAVRLSGPASGPLQLAEGPETGLSAWASCEHETWILLGGFAKAEHQLGRPVVLCRDDDKRHSPADNQLRRIVSDWRAKRVDAKVATPWRTRRFDKSDLNDTMQAQGVHGVRRRIDLALNPLATAVERQPIATVRRLLDTATAKFFEAAAAWVPPSDEDEDGPRRTYPDGSEFGGGAGGATPPPVQAIKVDVGAGKSRAAYRYALRRLLVMRAQGDTRTIAVAVPTHLLGDQQAETFAAIAAESGSNLTARVYRGMEAPDPRHPDFLNDSIPREQKTKMCQNLDAVKAAREASAPVSKAACRQKSAAGVPALGIEPGAFITCPFFGVCGTQEQKQASADLWIVPHELLFLERPAALGNVGLVIVDESCWQDGLEGTSGRPTSVAFKDLERQDRIVTQDGMVNHLDTDRLMYLRSSLLDALNAQTDGSVLRDAMMSGVLTTANVAEAYRLEFRRMVDPGLRPRMTEAERRACVRAAQGNARVLHVARVWKGLMALLAADGPEASGWLTLATEHDREDKPFRVLQTKGRRAVRAGWIAPTLILDATLNVDLLRPYWPQVEVTAELLATAPHQHVRQVIDRAYSKSMLAPADEETALADPDLARRRNRNLRRVHAIIVREARRYAPARVLVVCQKAIKEALHRFGMIPPNVELAHHNAVAGRDDWGPQPDRDGVRALIVVGRTMPAIGSVNRLAEALTGVAVHRPEGGWYDRGDAVREMADGIAVATEAERHPDPIAEAIRWQICEGELVQIIGRPRGVNRTSENPVDVLLLTDIAVPVPVEATLSSADLEPSSDDMMFAAGGIAFENGRHAHTAYPDLWPSWEAARKALKRAADAERSGTFLQEDSSFLEECPTPLTRVDYQVAGPGQKPAVAWCDLGTLLDPGAFLAAKLGALAFVRLTLPEMPEPPDPPVRPAGRQLEPTLESAGGDAVPIEAGQRPPPPKAGTAAFSPAAALPADLDWGRHVWLADHEMPGEWWPGVMPRPALALPVPIRVNARTVRPQWHETTGDDWRNAMPLSGAVPARDLNTAARLKE